MTISQVDWTRLLSELGYGRRRLVELPPTPNAADSRWEDAANQVFEMSVRLAKGDSGSALSEGRPALRTLLEIVGHTIGRPRKPSENDGPYTDVVAARISAHYAYRSNDAYEVLAESIELAKSVFGFSSELRHTGMRSTERLDAELALGLITTLYGFFARFPLEQLVEQNVLTQNSDATAG